MRPLYKEELDQLMTCGCGEPGCKNKAEWLHARCHTKSGIQVKYGYGFVNISCMECGRLIVELYYDKIALHKNISIEANKVKVEIPSYKECPTPKCSPKTGYDIRYVRGKLELYCNRCKEFVRYVYISKKKKIK